jgi:hypothetical protein
MRMLDIDLPVPDHTTLSRRASGLPVHGHGRIGTGELHLIVDSTGLKLRGAGEWLFEKHGTAKRRSWRKLHIGIDADNGEIVAFDLTDRQGRRPRFACRAPIGSIGRRTSFIQGRRRL